MPSLQCLWNGIQVKNVVDEAQVCLKYMYISSSGQEVNWGSITVLLGRTFKRQRSTIISTSPFGGPDLASGSTRQQNIIIPLNLVAIMFKYTKNEIVQKCCGLIALHCAIWGKLGTALQAYNLNPCTKFPPNPSWRVHTRVSQKTQKSEFCFATNPTGFHRLDEPPEKNSAL